MSGVRIDNLQPTINPSANADVPVMHDGQTFRYSVSQIAVIARLFNGSASDFDFSATSLGAALIELGNAVVTKADAAAVANELNSAANALASRVRVDAAQSLTGEQQAQGRANIGLDVGYRYVTTLAFTSSNTFEKDDYPWARRIKVRQQAPGGGSGHAASTSSGQAAESGGGGGGEYKEGWFDPDDLDASENITLGAPGSAGTGGNPGGNAGDSSFAGMVSKGGKGGAAGAANSVTLSGGTSDEGAWGDKVLPEGRLGIRGESAPSLRITTAGLTTLSNKGGRSHLGPGGAIPDSSSSPGNPGIQGSGAGGVRTANGSAQAGAVGGSPLTFIDLFA